MDWTPIIKALLSLGIQGLTMLIPFIGSLAGGPFGFLVGWAISWLSGMLVDWIGRLARYNAIDADIAAKKTTLVTAQQKLAAAQVSATATKEDHAKAIADFMAAASAFGQFRVPK